MYCDQRILLPQAVVLSVFLLLCGCGGTVTAPTSFDRFNAKDGKIQCEVPTGWEQDGGSKKKFRGCRFTSGPAKIKISADMTGSLFGDIAQTGSNIGGMGGALNEVPEDLTPVAKVHEITIKQVSEDLGELAIQTTETIKTGFGDTRRSEFTVSGTFGGTKRGYLVTALGLNHRFIVICTCPDDQWATLQPAFDRVIGGLDRGNVE